VQEKKVSIVGNMKKIKQDSLSLRRNEFYLQIVTNHLNIQQIKDLNLDLESASFFSKLQDFIVDTNDVRVLVQETLKDIILFKEEQSALQ